RGESPATFPRTRELQSQQCRSPHSSDTGCTLRRGRLVFHAQFPQPAMPVLHVLEWSPADAPAFAAHQRSPLRCARAQNPDPKSDSSRATSLQLRWKFADQVLNLFRFVPVTNQKRVRGPYDDQIMHSE